ncbi:MAG: RNA helicase, partial [Nakamurella sp.]
VTRTPSGSAATALLETTRVWAEIAGRERALGLPPTREPDSGFAAAVAAWCRGKSLTDALTVAIAGGTDLSAGDFVRWCRQVIDLLDQVAGVSRTGVGAAARSAVGSLRRGVVSMGAV